MDWMLTDGEIKSETVAWLGSYPDDNEMAAFRGVARAAVKKAYNWLMGDCTEHDPPAYIAALPMARSECVECLQALKAAGGK